MKVTPFLEYVLYDIFDERDDIKVRAMMGGYILYKEGKVVALAENDELWLKGGDEVADWYMSRGSKKFSYLKPARVTGGEAKVQEMNFFLVPEEVLENREEWKEWLDVAMSVAEIPKKKGARRTE